MANFSWVRLWLDMPTDPKFRTIARVSEQPLSAVIAVFVMLLTDAANATERGKTKLNAEDIGSALDLDVRQVEAITDAMQGRVLDGDKLTGWEKRQPLREDGSADRARAWREKRKVERKQTEANALERSEEDADTDTDAVTVPNGTVGGIATAPPEPQAEGKSRKQPPTPYKALVDLYHECCPRNPRVQILNEQRKGHLRARWREMPTLEEWRAFFEIVAASKFLTGQVAGTNQRKPFVADLDWLTRPVNFAKVIEGKYNDGERR